MMVFTSRIIGATSIVFSYLGEFLADKERDSMLGRLEIFWNIGVILLPGKSLKSMDLIFLTFYFCNNENK